MIPIIILLVSSIVHLINVGKPASVVFDEVFYGNFITQYWHGTFFFDLHPPLFKLIAATVGLLIGTNNYPADWSTIGNSLPPAIVGIRLISTIAGILLPLVIYAICRRLNFSKLISFTAAILICLENSLVVQSRFILPDVTMLLAGFGSIWLYLEYIRRIDKRSSWIFAGSTILAASALSIKWTGLTYLFLIIIMEAYRLSEARKINAEKIWSSIKKLTSFIFKYGVIAAFIYIGLFAIHFAALPYSGDGDAFMSAEFQRTLIGNHAPIDTKAAPDVFIVKFLELNHEMYSASASMTATHPYSSKWYTWPFMQRTVFYWQDNTATSSPSRSYIYLLGNPFIYWLGTASFIIVLSLLILGFINKDFLLRDQRKKDVLFILVVGYLINLLPFIFIGRVMFLYHYETSLIFSILSIVFLLDLIEGKKKIIIIAAVITISLGAFIYWSPLTYGTPLTDQQLESLMWLPSWR